MSGLADIEMLDQRRADNQNKGYQFFFVQIFELQKLYLYGNVYIVSFY